MGIDPRNSVCHGSCTAVKHQRISNKIAYQLEKLLKNSRHCNAYLPVDWEITEYTVVQPDNMVVCGENIEEEKLTIPPVLVFEILSPSSTRMDRIIKYQLYQEAGVKYYCIVDPESRSAEVFQLKGNEYKGMREDQEGKMTFHLGECIISFDFGELFKE